MSLALSNGASVVAFIGLTAQTLRGILYIYEIIASVRETPADLRCLYLQLKFFQLVFTTFRESVAEAARLGILTRLDKQTRLALDDAEGTIKDLQLVVQKYGEGRATNLRKRINVALRRKQLTKLSQRLSNVSAQVDSTHTGIALMAQMHRSTLSSLAASDLESKFLILGNNISAASSETITQQFESVNQVLNEATESVFKLIAELSQKIDRITYQSTVCVGVDKTSSDLLYLSSSWVDMRELIPGQEMKPMEQMNLFLGRLMPLHENSFLQNHWMTIEEDFYNPKKSETPSTSLFSKTVLNSSFLWE